MTRHVDIRDAFFDELYQIAGRDDSVIFMTADMGAFSLERFRRDFPDRFINVGISEQNMVSVAAGLSMAGKRVFIYAIIPFITLRCLEQIKVDLCVMNLPVTLVGAGAGLTYSSDGPTHQGIEDVAIMRALPGMTIYNPSEEVTARFSAIDSSRAAGPVYVRLDKGVWPALHLNGGEVSAGLSFVRQGTKTLVVATGCMTHTALRVAEALCGCGINPSVLDLFRLKPVPEVLVEIAQRFDRIVTIEEHTLPGGMGSAVLELLADHGLTIPVQRFGIPDKYLERYGDRTWMQTQYGLDDKHLVKHILEWP